MSDEAKKSEGEKDAPKEEKEDETMMSDVEVIDTPTSASLNMTLFLYWILPVLILSIVSRFGVSPRAPLPTSAPPRPIALDLGKQKQKAAEKLKQRKQKEASPTAAPTVALSKTPTSYQKVVKEIQKRRPRWDAGLQTGDVTSIEAASSAPKAAKEKQESQAAPSDVRTPSDPQRRRMDEVIGKWRKEYKVGLC